MDTGEQVGRRIRLPKLTHQNRKYIVARHGVKPQMLNIRNKRRNHQKNQHSRAQKHCTSVIVAPILEKQIPEHSWYISKPEQVRHDKIFTERYIIINVHMHYHILHIGAVLPANKTTERRSHRRLPTVSYAYISHNSVSLLSSFAAGQRFHPHEKQRFFYFYTFYTIVIR